MAYWLGRGVWSGAELAALLLLAALLNGPMIYRACRDRWIRRRRDALGLPPATDQEILAFITEALDAAKIDWEWRPSPKPPSKWREIALGEDDDAIFLFVGNGVIEVVYGDDGPEIFLDEVELISHIISLRGIYDPIDKEIPFEDTDDNGL